MADVADTIDAVFRRTAYNAVHLDMFKSLVEKWASQHDVYCILIIQKIIEK